jgi:hypothetical protein
MIELVIHYSEVLLVCEVLTQKPKPNLSIEVGVVVLPSTYCDLSLFENSPPNQSFDAILLESVLVEELFPNLEGPLLLNSSFVYESRPDGSHCSVLRFIV